VPIDHSGFFWICLCDWEKFEMHWVFFCKFLGYEGPMTSATVIFFLFFILLKVIECYLPISTAGTGNASTSSLTTPLVSTSTGASAVRPALGKTHGPFNQSSLVFSL
jgi:hypothetical protein